MDRRYSTVVLALIAGTYAPAAFAQTRGVTVVTPLTGGMPVGGGIPALPVEPGGPAASFGINPFGPALSPALEHLTPTLTIAPVLPLQTRLATALVGPAAEAAVTPPAGKGGSLAKAGVSARASLEASVKALSAPEAKSSPLGVSNALLSAFDAGRAAAADPVEDFRAPGWSENARVSDAVRRIYDSPSGREVYDLVWKQHGRDLRISIDDDPAATYDARMGSEGGRPVLSLTRELVEKQSTEVLASYIVRGLADLYNATYPASVEKTYLAYSRQVRTYAELTGSGVDGRWDTTRDQWNGNGYVLQTYYKYWRQAVTDRRDRARNAQSSEFFRFLRDSDDSTVDPAAKATLRERYERGEISYETYSAMNRYFEQFMDAESRWLAQSRR